MKNILEKMKNPIIACITGIIFGFIIGLPIFGWWIWPVHWINAAPEHLRPDLQVEYLCMIIDSNAQTQDSTRALSRFNELGNDRISLLQNITPIECGNTSIVAIDAFRAIVGVNSGITSPTIEILPMNSSIEGSTGTPNPNQPAIENSDTGSINSLPTTIFVFLLIGTLLTGAGVFYFFVLKPRKLIGKSTFHGSINVESSENQHPDLHSQETDVPLAQFMTTYMHGDDLYDDSFSIDGPNGEFLGECGVGITETIGVGDPKKITAFEVWLFDKNDIQTITKMLMSQHAFNDKAISQKLTAKGELVIIEPGKKILLETASLQLEARIVDASYGAGAMPPGSYFDRLTLELAIWSKG